MTAQITGAPEHSRTRDMGISHAEFLRTFTSAFRDRPYTRDGDALILSDEKRQARIELSPQVERVLASVRLPTTLVTFQFVGYSHHEVEAFMRRFDLYFHRGGG